ncbi:MAG: hypothetical protein E7012_05340 [Alphaproteobacteria bacterium]|nr:hypothetical protein [Alphaproteobacteria bacterium]
MDEEFIDELSEQQRITFVRALFFMIKADSRVDDAERSFMHDVIKMYGLVNKLDVLTQPISQDIILQEISTNIQDRRTSLYLLRELLLVAGIDDDMEDKEAGFIEEVATVLKIEDEKVLAINELLLDRKIWLRKLATVMEDEE